jgi:ribose 5-phosphate isomerase B
VVNYERKSEINHRVKNLGQINLLTMFDKSKTLALGCDQGGYALKEFLKIKLAESGYSVRDFGSYSPESIDYPDMAHPVASAVNEGMFPMALLICGSGNGVCMTANKHAGIRAALCWNTELARLARLHNDANILCLPGRFISENEALSATLTFLKTDFEGGRHLTRIEKIPVK